MLNFNNLENKMQIKIYQTNNDLFKERKCVVSVRTHSYRGCSYIMLSAVRTGFPPFQGKLDTPRKKP